MKPFPDINDSMESMKHLEYLYHVAVAMENDDQSQIEAASDCDGLYLTFKASSNLNISVQ